MQEALPMPVRSPAAQWRRRGSMAQDAALVVLFALFAYVQGRHVIVDRDLTEIPFALEQSVLVVIFLTRRRSYSTSTRVSDWLVASVGGWLPFAFQLQDDTPPALSAAGLAIQVVGLSATIVCFLYLGRSFGIVAANRGLKTAGPYAFLRHPIYLSHAVTTTGFLVGNFAGVNVALVAIVMVCQILRIQAEERHLTATADYREYSQRVRWRLVPGLY